MVRHALGDVEHEVRQVFLPDVDRARQVHMVGLEAMRDQGQEQDVAIRPLRRLLADTPDQGIVSVQREMIAVVLDGACGQHDDWPLLRVLAQFLLGMVLIEVRSNRHRFNPARATRGRSQTTASRLQDTQRPQPRTSMQKSRTSQRARQR